MTRLETPAGTIEFETELRKLRNLTEEAEAEKTTTQATPETPKEPGPKNPTMDPTGPDEVKPDRKDPGFVTNQFNDARRMVEVSPVGAIVTAWNALMAECEETLQRNEIKIEKGRPREVIKQVEDLGLPGNIRRLLFELRLLRNRAVHDIGDSVTPDAAYNFVVSSQTVSQKIRDL